jgi:hypothetical protein
MLLAGLASVGWAVALWYVVRYPLDGAAKTAPDPVWAAATLVSAVFTLMCGLLYARGHPDARVVGLFGAIIFAIPNFVVAGRGFLDLDAEPTCADVILTATCKQHQYPLPEATVILLVTGAVALTALQAAILAFAAPKRKPAAPDAVQP